MDDPTSSTLPLFIDNEVIVLGKNGTWLSDGGEITHDSTRRLFARSLKKDNEGYYLSVGRESKRIVVEDTAYFIHRIDGNPKQGYKLWINDETEEFLNPSTIEYKPGRLVCWIKGKTERARFLPSAYYDLLSHLQEDDSNYYLEIRDQKVVLSQKL